MKTQGLSNISRGEVEDFFTGMTLASSPERFFMAAIYIRSTLGLNEVKEKTQLKTS